MALNYGPDSLTSQLAESIMAAFLDGVRSYAEQGYNAVQCSYSITSGISGPYVLLQPLR